ncbi:MAG: transglycosylase SLT domain-containing protein [Fimbriimonadaceae bacterium]|nr:transglycosylase SLT domain-containing protein [Fimbriimonadaceae bacterium]
MNIRLRGFEGASQRMQELQSRVDSLSLNRQSQVPSPGFTPQPFPLPSLEGQIGGNMRVVPGGLSSPLPLDPGSLGIRPAGGQNPLAPLAEWPKATPELRGLIRSTALKHGLDPDVFEALVQTESSYENSTVSRAGAQGLTQLMPGTARMLGVQNPFNPAENLEGGARYLSQMLKQFDNNLPLALAAYNAGPGAVQRHGGIPPFAETQNYVKRVTDRAEGLRR